MGTFKINFEAPTEEAAHSGENHAGGGEGDGEQESIAEEKEMSTKDESDSPARDFELKTHEPKP